VLARHATSQADVPYTAELPVTTAEMMDVIAEERQPDSIMCMPSGPAIARRSP
jgi:hypothetical protein